MTTQLAPDRLAPDRLALPPPLELDLAVDDRLVGWIDGDAIGFHGFADETEAVHAAWVAHRTLARRLARSHGIRAVPIDSEPLALQRRSGEELILASGRPFATLVRPGQRQDETESFAFRIRVPHSPGEVRMRAMALLVYRALRKSGIRWALWRPARRAPTPITTSPTKEDRMTPHTAPSHLPLPPPRATRKHRASNPRPATRTPSPTAFVAAILFAAIAIVMAGALIAAAPLTVTIPLGFVFGTGVVATTVAGFIDRNRSRRRSRRSGWARARRAHAAGVTRRTYPAVEMADASHAGAGWGSVAAFSVLLLLLALAVPQTLGIPFAAVGLAGLLTFRLAAMRGGVAPRALAAADDVRSGGGAHLEER